MKVFSLFILCLLSLPAIADSIADLAPSSYYEYDETSRIVPTAEIAVVTLLVCVNVILFFILRKKKKI